MKTSRWTRLQAIFEEATPLDADQRKALLGSAADLTPSMRATLESLLLHHDASDASSDASPGDYPEISIFAGASTRIGRFTIEKRLGAGGMGAVYLARQDEPSRLVALKILHFGLDAPAARRRFREEWRILGMLRHPNIAPVFDVGVHEEGSLHVPYFAMEYIPEALPITEYADRHVLDIENRLRLFEPVCAAVHHGHLSGVLHHDLKPSNILVDASGRPRIIDFGVARATDADVATVSRVTTTGELVGTLQYMSPEQISGESTSLDTRSDVFSLGVVLHELLCDQPPLDLAGLPVHEAVLRARDFAPTRRTLSGRRLSRDLETLVFTTLQPDRERRPASVEALGADVGRVLRHEPIRVKPPHLPYRVRLLARRHRAWFWSITSMFVLLVAFAAALVIVAIGLQRDLEERYEAAAAIELFRERIVEEGGAPIVESALELPRAWREQAAEEVWVLIWRPRTDGGRQLPMLTTIDRDGHAVRTLDSMTVPADLGLEATGTFRAAVSRNVEIADIISEWPGPELLAILRHKHRSTSVLHVFSSADRSNSFQILNDGHFQSGFFHAERNAVVALAVSNDLPHAVLNPERIVPRPEAPGSDARVIVSIPAGSIRHDGVLFPATGSREHPVHEECLMLVVEPPAAELKQLGLRMSIASIEQPPIGRNALCQVTLDYKLGSDEPRFRTGLLSPEGAWLENFEADLAAEELPVPTFTSLDVRALHAAGRFVDAAWASGVAIEDLPETTRQLAAGSSEQGLAVRLAYARVDDWVWQAREARRLLRSDGSPEDLALAMNLAEYACGLAPESWQARLARGIANCLAGLFEPACEDLEFITLHDKGRDSAEGAGYLAIARAETGEPGRAKADFARLEALVSKTEVYADDPDMKTFRQTVETRLRHLGVTLP